MLDGYYLHLIDSLLPSSSSQQEWGRLENLAALKFCKFIEDFGVARKVLPHLPRLWFKPLFRSVVYDFYYKFEHDQRVLSCLPDSLMHLLLFWPHESFILEEIIPTLQPSFVEYQTKSLVDLRNDLHVFYGKLSTLLAKAILQSKADPDAFANISSPLNIVDISGFVRDESKICCPKVLLDIMKVIANPYELYSTLASRNIHLISELEVDVQDNNMRAVSDILDLNMEPGSLIEISFNKVKFKISPRYDFLTSTTRFIIYKILSRSKTEYVQLVNDKISDDTTACFLANLPELKGLSVTNISLPLMRYLKSMPELEQLDLSNIGLQGHLEAICNRENGLEYLNLRGCELCNQDLDTLIQSPHLETLRQLDIGLNTFCDPEYRMTGLLSFCQHLKNVEILDITCCKLHSWNVGMIGQLMEILRDLPKLLILILDYNLFSSKVLMMYVTQLGKSNSLRYLSVSSPTDVYDLTDTIQVKNKNTDDFIFNFSKAINMRLPSKVLRVSDPRRLNLRKALEISISNMGLNNIRLVNQ
ncbi:unnamed protein product, partial [Meganyctiphanes norvegica]